MKSTHYVLFVFILLMLSGCVPSKKYQDLESAKLRSDQELRSSQEALSKSQNENRILLDDMQKKNKQLTTLSKDTTEMSRRVRAAQDLNAELERRYKQVLAQNDALITNSSSASRESTEELAKIQNELRQKELELMRKESQLATMQGDLSVRSENNEQLQSDLASRTAQVSQLEKSLKEKESRLVQLEQDLAIRETRVRELETLIADQDRKAKALKKSISNALLGFSASDLSVMEKNGKVYVSLSQNLLFATGSRVLDSKGKAALRTLADVLKKNPDIEITIEGHTDSVGETPANWDLSVLRATTIVNELTKNGIKPEKITASGRGEHFPVDSNETSAGRAKNRRTEIILSPKLDLLYDLLDN